LGELDRLLLGPPEELHQRGAGRGEPLGHLVAHARVEVRGLPAQVGEPPPEAARGDHEDRQQHEREQRGLQRERDHHAERERELDAVGQHGGQRRGDRRLGPDDVVVEPAHERAGAGAGEERDRHPLDVLEDRPAQIDDHALPDAGGEPTRGEPHDGLEDRECRDAGGEPDHGGGGDRGLAARDDRVHHPPGEDGGEHPDRRRDDREQQVGQEPAAVGAGERPDPRDRALLDRFRRVRGAHDPPQHAHRPVHTRPPSLTPSQPRFPTRGALHLLPRTYYGLTTPLKELTMPPDPPDRAALAAAAERYGLGLSEADLDSFSPFVHGLLASWEVVEQLYPESAPAAPERAWQRPDDADNPYGAWYVTTEITEGGEGPLAGRTVAIKDNTAVAGVPMMNGSAYLEGYVPLRDATVVSRLLAAGATIAGKAVCEDLCFSGGSHTSRPAPVRNPWDETRSAGGSSSGSAALVAGGVVDLATGGDQGGSVRIPAAYSGIVGHKPTFGLVPYTGAFPIEQTIDHIGPMTRTVADAALMLSVLAGPDGLDPRQPRDLVPDDYVGALARGAEGMRVGVVRE